MERRSKAFQHQTYDGVLYGQRVRQETQSPLGWEAQVIKMNDMEFFENWGPIIGLALFFTSFWMWAWILP